MQPTVEPLPLKIKLGEKYGPAMTITEQDQADAYFARLVEHTLRWRPELSKPDAEAIERQNLGYWAGYYDNETRSRVEALFKCEHPYFGKIDVEGPPTADQAFAIGKAMARASRLKQ